MSVLAHYLEDEGIATTVISLIRLHTEKVRSPRALWVPFELGRPLGAPGNVAFQRRVLGQALGLFDRGRGPVLEDFDEDEPGSADDGGWTPPLDTAPSEAAQTVEAARAALEQEVKQLTPHYQAAVERHGRTTVGLSGLPMEAAIEYVSAFLAQNLPRKAPPQVPWPDLAGAHVLRYAADDLRSFYLEAAMAVPGHPSSRQLNDWYWQRTAAGQVMKAVRANALENGDKLLRMMAGLVLVPVGQVATK